MDFDKIWEDLQGRLESVVAKSNVLLKYVVLVALISLAFGLRVFGFVKVRGTNEVDDMFHLAMNTGLSSTGISHYFHPDSGAFEGTVVFPGLKWFVCGLQCFLAHAGIALSVEALYTLSGPLLASGTVIGTYLLGKELKDEATGLIAGGAMVLLPGFFALSVDGSQSNVVAGGCALVFAFYFFVKSVKERSIVNAALAGVAQFALASVWSGYVFTVMVLTVFVAILLALNKSSAAVYKSFTVFYIVSTGLSLLLPAVGFQFFLHLEHFPALAVFILLQLQYQLGMHSLVKPIAGLFAIVLVGAAVLGLLFPSRGFSVFSAHFFAGDGLNWLAFFRDLHLVLFLFPAGVFLCLRKLKSDVHLFMIAYAAVGLILASISGHFAPAFFPAAAVLAALGLSSTFKLYLKNQDAPVRKTVGATKPISKEINFAVIAGMSAVVMFYLVYSFSAATHPSIYIPQGTSAFHGDIQEAASWIQHNTPKDSRFVSWKGLGHQLSTLTRSSVLGTAGDDRAVLAEVSKALLSEEAGAQKIFQNLGVDYIVVIFGGASGYYFDDLNRVHEMGSEMQFTEEALLFKLSYKGFAELFMQPGQPAVDVIRQQPIYARPQIAQFQEVFTSQNWLVRVYQPVSEPSPASQD